MNNLITKTHTETIKTKVFTGFVCKDDFKSKGLFDTFDPSFTTISTKWKNWITMLDPKHVYAVYQTMAKFTITFRAKQMKFLHCTITVDVHLRSLKLFVQEWRQTMELITGSRILQNCLNIMLQRAILLQVAGNGANLHQNTLWVK